MKKLLIASALLLLISCASDPSIEHGRDGTIAYLVQVESNPPGAKIENNGELAGIAPCTIKIFGDKDGTFHNFGNANYVVKAYPGHDGETTQTKTFHCGAWFGPEDRIPKTMYFDMKSAPAAEPR